MIRKIKITACLLALLGGLAITPAHAQSFNCRYARHPDEVMICQNPHLSELDARMAGLYFSSFEYLGDSVDALKVSQRRWQRLRGRCGYNYNCIETLYEQRIKFLNGIGEEGE